MLLWINELLLISATGSLRMWTAPLNLTEFYIQFYTVAESALQMSNEFSEYFRLGTSPWWLPQDSLHFRDDPVPNELNYMDVGHTATDPDLNSDLPMLRVYNQLIRAGCKHWALFLVRAVVRTAVVWGTAVIFRKKINLFAWLSLTPELRS